MSRATQRRNESERLVGRSARLTSGYAEKREVRPPGAQSVRAVRAERAGSPGARTGLLNRDGLTRHAANRRTANLPAANRHVANRKSASVAAKTSTSRVAMLLVAVCTLLTATAQVLMKISMAGDVSFSSLLRWQLLLGGVLYAIATVLLMFALKRGELSVLYPIVSLGFIWVTLGSVFLLHESLPILRWLGIACIIVGIIALGHDSTRIITRTPGGKSGGRVRGVRYRGTPVRGSRSRDLQDSRTKRMGVRL